MEHIPVLLSETIELLNVKPNGIYADCTAGRGGHSAEILARLETGRLYCFDRDQTAVDYCRDKFTGKPATVIKSNFADIAEHLGNTLLDGIIADLGVSSPQFDDASRGFSYHYDTPLDMRMDRTSSLTAMEIINNYTATELKSLLYKYGEEKFAPRIADRIVRERENAPIVSTLRLAEIIANAYPAKFRGGSHPAKQSFQALRIAVNGELDALEALLYTAPKLLKQGGRLCIITFHSLEDRLVKQCFNKLSVGCICPPELPRCVCGHAPEYTVLTRKPIAPSDREVTENNRARSAKLRGVERE